LIGRAAPDGLIVPVRLTPKASRDAIEGLREDAAGGRVLAVKVTAVPEKGKANAALEKLLARALGVAGGRVEVVGGLTSRNKDVLMRGDPVEIAALLEKLMGEQGV
jgi:uncharacterized protein (TIGR00251 family)